MPISKLRPALLSLAPLAFVLQGCASYPAAESPAPPPAPVAEPPAPTGPERIKVAYGKVPLWAGWERMLCKEREPCRKGAPLD